jgi:phosphatidylglycerophosphate synthase
VVIGTVCQWTERIYPEFLNANFITMVGQIPQLLTLLMVMFTMGLDLRGDSSSNYDRAFYWCGLALFWFNHHDLMDGVRARRQKSGSAFGRFFDEANDMIQMTCYSVSLAYLWRLDNVWLEGGFFLALNVIFFAMEMKHLLCNQLVLTCGEIGQLEIENMFAVFFVLGGIYGSKVFEKTLGKMFGFCCHSFPGSGLISHIQLKHMIVCGLLLV